MKRIAFKMKLHKGFEEEYKKRHEVIWPDLAALLKLKGVNDYSIFLDEETNILFAIMKVEDPSLLDSLPEEPVMKKWWAYMKDIMDCNMDNSPVSIPLKDVFYFP